MNPYRQFVAEYVKTHQSGQSLPLGGFAPEPAPSLDADAPKVIIFSPHPDDECIIGGIALRLLRESRMRVVNVAVTQGRIKARQEERWHELTQACLYLGFDLVGARPGGLERIVSATRRDEPGVWADAVGVIKRILESHRPRAVLFPHEHDWNSTHIGTHLLLTDAMSQMDPGFACHVIETEFWGQMMSPNLLVESSEKDVSDLVAATSFHAGEVRRNPYHVLLPAWMQDNVRRGAELVGGQGTAAPKFTFATVYRLRRWEHGGWKAALAKGRFLPAGENPASLFD